MKWVRRIVLIALFVGLLWASMEFISRNEAQVIVDLIGVQSPPIPIWAVMVVSFVAGAACALAATLGKVLKQGLVARRYRKTVAGLESEIHQLRNLPLAGTEGDVSVAPAVSGGAPAEPGG